MFYLSRSRPPARFFILSSFSPAGPGVGGPFFPFTAFFSLKGCRVQWPNQRLLHSNQLGVMTKKACNKGTLCNLMGLEIERDAHFNELRSPFSNLGGGRN